MWSTSTGTATSRDRRLEIEECDIDRRLETWDDPTPRDSKFTLKDLREACIAAAKHHFSLMAKRPTREERVRRREEHDCKILKIALDVYAKQNGMQPTDLEFVETKMRNLIDEQWKSYLHFNFLVKGSDGKHTVFFAEVHPDLKDEKDVYLCTPLDECDSKASEENEQARCNGCKDRAKDLIHPTHGGFLGGHEDVIPPFTEESDSDYEFVM